NITHADLAQAIIAECKVDFVILKHEEKSVCVGITKGDWENFYDRCKLPVNVQVGKIEEAGLRERPEATVQYGYIENTRDVNNANFFNELWLLSYVDSKSNESTPQAEGSMNKAREALVNLFSIEKHRKQLEKLGLKKSEQRDGELPYDMPITHDIVLNHFANAIRGKLGLDKDDPERVGFVLFKPKRRALQYATFSNFELTPIAVYDDLLFNNNRSVVGVNVANRILRVLSEYLDKYIKKESKSKAEEETINKTIEWIEGKINQIKEAEIRHMDSFEDIIDESFSDILKELNRKTGNIKLEKSNVGIFEGIDELGDWLVKAEREYLDKLDKDEKEIDDKRKVECFLQCFGRHIIQPYHTGFMPYFVDARGVKRLNNMSQDIICMKIERNWIYQILTFIESYLDVAGASELLGSDGPKPGQELSTFIVEPDKGWEWKVDTCWVVLVPLYSRGQRKGFMYIHRPYYYYKKDGEEHYDVAKGDGLDEIEKEDLFAPIEEKRKEASIISNQVADLIQSVDNIQFLYEISEALAAEPDPSFKKFTALVMKKLYNVCNVLYARFIGINPISKAEIRGKEKEEKFEVEYVLELNKVNGNGDWWWNSKIEKIEVPQIQDVLKKGKCPIFDSLLKIYPRICDPKTCKECNGDKSPITIGEGKELLRWGSCFVVPIADRKKDLIYGVFEIFLEEDNLQEFEDRKAEMMQVISSAYSFREAASLIEDLSEDVGWKVLAGNLGHNIKNFLFDVDKQIRNRYELTESPGLYHLYCLEADTVKENMLWLKIASKGTTGEEWRECSVGDFLYGIVKSFVRIYDSLSQRFQSEPDDSSVLNGSQVGTGSPLGTLLRGGIYYPPVLFVTILSPDGNREIAFSTATTMPNEGPRYPFAFENVLELSEGLIILQEKYRKNLYFVIPSMRDDLYSGRFSWQEGLREIENYVESSILDQKIGSIITEFEIGFEEMFYNTFIHGSRDSLPFKIQCTIDLCDKHEVSFSNPINLARLKDDLLEHQKKTVSVGGLTGVGAFWNKLQRWNEQKTKLLEKGWDVEHNTDDIKSAHESGTELPREFWISIRRRK
nr:hypothetical protein [Deltaproteobacteria bacterium]